MNFSTNTKSTLLLLLVPVTLAVSYVIYSSIQTSKNKSRPLRSSNKGRAKYSVIDETGQAKVEEDSKSLKTWTALGLEQPLVIAMVGLPARGKSYITKMIIRYLKWTGFECKNFNVGSYRRKIGLASADANFFDTNNSNANKVREDMAMAVQEEMYTWLHEGEGTLRVAIFDATNTTMNRRLALAQKARKENVFLLFVESICDDIDVLNRNYDLKLDNDDYKGMDPVKAKEDFMSRVHAYEKVYQTIEDSEDNSQICYIKLINVGQKVITRNCTGYLPSQVAFYLQNVHILPRKIYLCLNAENDDMVAHEGRLASSESGQLTEAGAEYSTDLAKFIYAKQHELEEESLAREILVLAGTSRVHAETILHLRTLFKCYNTPLLNELRGGDLHGFSRDEIKQLYPDEYRKRQDDKLRYRYPGVGGESYLDVIERIRPVIIELERQRRSVVVICHLAVMRCIVAYFMGVKLDEIPFQTFRRHFVYELSPGPFGCPIKEVSPTEELKHM